MTDDEFDMNPLEISRDALDKALLKSPQILDKTIFDWIPVEKIFSDVYCRPLIPSRVTSIKESWDDDAVAVCLVSFRDKLDMYACLDGNHRVAVARALGVTHVPCRIYIDLTLEEEAALYTKFGNVRKQNPVDKFRARLVQKDPQALNIERILHKYGLEIAFHTGPGNGKIRAVAELDKIYGAHGPEALDWIIGTTAVTWGGDLLAYSSWALQGMTAFWMRYHTDPQFRYKHFIKRLQRTGIRLLQQKANLMKAAMTTAQGIRNAWGRCMWEIYNYKLPEEHRLKEWADTFATPHGKKKSAEATARSNRKRGEEFRKKKGGH